MEDAPVTREGPEKSRSPHLNLDQLKVRFILSDETAPLDARHLKPSIQAKYWGEVVKLPCWLEHIGSKLLLEIIRSNNGHLRPINQPENIRLNPAY
jgi:hypothetical protein